MGERGVRNAEVEGSNPLPSTIWYNAHLDGRRRERLRRVPLGADAPLRPVGQDASNAPRSAGLVRSEPRAAGATTGTDRAD